MTIWDHYQAHTSIKHALANCAIQHSILGIIPEGKSFYNTDWQSLKYFVSSSLTAFSLNMLKRMDIEIVIGQLSYKQIAEVFNLFTHQHQIISNKVSSRCVGKVDTCTLVLALL